MKTVMAAALLLALAACSPKQEAQDARAPMAQAAAGMASRAAPPPDADAAPSDAPAPASEATGGEKQDEAGKPQDLSATGGALLAYAYEYGLEVPPAQVAPVMKAQEKICTDAGLAVCQVLGASTSSAGEDDVSAQLSLRAEPHWLAKFRDRLEGDAEKAGGKMKSSNTTTEDLTRQITDTTAVLNAKKTERDQLRDLLAHRVGKLSDVLDVERELARVQGEIDSTESDLAVAKQRVAMSALTINYASAGKPLTDTTFEPIKEALQNFLRTIAGGFAIMITIIAALAPWVIVIGGIWWLVLRWLRKRRAAIIPPPRTQTPD